MAAATAVAVVDLPGCREKKGGERGEGGWWNVWAWGGGRNQSPGKAHSQSRKMGVRGPRSTRSRQPQPGVSIASKKPAGSSLPGGSSATGRPSGGGPGGDGAGRGTESPRQQTRHTKEKKQQEDIRGTPILTRPFSQLTHPCQESP